MPFVSFKDLAKALKDVAASRYIDLMDMGVSPSGSTIIVGIDSTNRLVSSVIGPGNDGALSASLANAIANGRLLRVEVDGFGFRGSVKIHGEGREIGEVVRALAKNEISLPQTVLAFPAIIKVVEDANGYRMICNLGTSIISLTVWRGSSKMVEAIARVAEGKEIPAIVFLRTRSYSPEEADPSDLSDPRKVIQKYRVMAILPLPEELAKELGLEPEAVPAPRTETKEANRSERVGEEKGEGGGISERLERGLDRILEMAFGGGEDEGQS